LIEIAWSAPMVKSNLLYTKLIGVLSNWLANFNPVTMTMADGLKAVQLVAPSLESLASLRVESQSGR